jgi:hypothetical protein
MEKNERLLGGAFNGEPFLYYTLLAASQATAPMPRRRPGGPLPEWVRWRATKDVRGEARPRNLPLFQLPRGCPHLSAQAGYHHPPGRHY